MLRNLAVVECKTHVKKKHKTSSKLPETLIRCITPMLYEIFFSAGDPVIMDYERVSTEPAIDNSPHQLRSVRQTLDPQWLVVRSVSYRKQCYLRFVPQSCKGFVCMVPRMLAWWAHGAHTKVARNKQSLSDWLWSFMWVHLKDQTDGRLFLSVWVFTLSTVLFPEVTSGTFSFHTKCWEVHRRVMIEFSFFSFLNITVSILQSAV